MIRSSILILAVVATLVVAGGTFPLGIPGEWVWDRFPLPLVATPLLPLGAAALFVALVLIGGQRFQAAGIAERTAWVGVLCAATFAWLCVLQEAVPSPYHQLSKAGWVLYYRGPSGYFTDAKASSEQRGLYLRQYVHELSKGDVLHAGTHPPGLIVAYWLVMDACRSSPSLAATLESTEPHSVRIAFAEISSYSRAPLALEDRAVLWLAFLLVQAAAAFTLVPLYLLLRADHDPVTSWYAASLWAGVPAVAIFLPKSDVLMACLGTCGLAAWYWSLRTSSSARSLSLAALAGLVFWLALCVSLAILPVGFAAALVTIWDVLTAPAAERPSRRSKVFRQIAAATLVGVTATAGVWLATGLNLPEAWVWNYRNHAAFYAQFTRTWWAWLAVNPLELAVASGLPVFVLAAASVPPRLQVFWQRENGLSAAFVATWLILWVSGKNSGEAARLWIFVMPWLCCLAAESLSPTAFASPAARRWFLALALGTQLLCSAVLTTHVSGFFNGQPEAAAPPTAK